MFPIHLPQKKSVLASFFILASLFFSCKKTENTGNIEQPADFSKKVIASINGFVTNEQDLPVAGARVQYGDLLSTTDQYGYFEIKNATVVENAAFVTVKMAGYFKGIKTFIAKTGTSDFCRIKLIPKTSSGNVNASTGGDVTLPNGLKVSLSSNSIIDAATKAPYSGTVNVSSFWINPTADDINEIMPGDLRGLNENGALKLLTSYGMAAVELTGNSGQLLQIADGKKAILTFPIPSSLSAAAPSNIPLWSFNESNGLWVQEGNAIKSGVNYVGEVSHFSFWNCDIPIDYVQFNCTVHNADGTPLPYATVYISVIGSSAAGAGYTDLSGYTDGPIPGNAQLLLQVFPGRCFESVYSQTLTTTNTNVSLDVTLPSTGINTAHISGTATNCANGPVSDGYVMMNVNNRYFRYPLSDNSSFDFPYTLCNGPASATFFVEDIAAGEQSTFLSYTLQAGENAVGNLHACATSTEEFINYTQDGVNFSYVPPTSSFTQYVYVQSSPTSIYIGGMDSVIGSASSANISIFFSSPGIAAGSTQQLMNFIVGQSQATAPINVNITEYGTVDQFIAGNFSGTLTSPPPTNTPTNVTCNFRVRRRQ